MSGPQRNNQQQQQQTGPLPDPNQNQGQNANTNGNGAQSAADLAAETLKREKSEAQAKIASIGDLGSLKGAVGTFGNSFAKEQAEGAAMVTRLETAVADTRSALASQPAKIKNYIDDRLPLLYAGAKTRLKQLVDGAGPGEKEKLEVPWALKQCTLTNAAVILAPEEETSDEVLDKTGGIYKVFDAYAVYDSMADDLKQLWESSHADKDAAKTAWLGQVRKNAPVPILPTNMPNSPAAQATAAQFQNATAATAYPGSVRGFVAAGEDKSKVEGQNFTQILKTLALDEAYYPSNVLMLGHMTADAAKAEQARKKAAGDGPALGKPTMFYLLFFKENRYNVQNRDTGTAGLEGDKGVGERELQSTGIAAGLLFQNNFSIVR